MADIVGLAPALLGELQRRPTNGYATVLNNSSRSVTFKCYDENDHACWVAYMEVTLSPGEIKDLNANGSSVKVYVNGVYKTIGKNKRHVWDGSKFSSV